MSRQPTSDNRQLSGWIAINKPIGMGSTDVVNRVKRIIRTSLRGGDLSAVALAKAEADEAIQSAAASGEKDLIVPQTRRTGLLRSARNDKIKIGHAGTLDPLASGVLLLALGDATKLVEYVMDRPKTYAFTIAWGEQRDTDDAEGKVVATSDKRPSREEIDKILPRFTGVIGQVPPKYSAVKIAGERAYDLARAGQEVEIAPRPVTVYSFECTVNTADSADFLATTGKGTYVRAFARDMAEVLGTKGYISALVRSSSGKCNLEDTISLEKLEELVHKGASTEWLNPVEWMLDDIPAWSVPPGIAKILRHGNSVRLIPKYVPEALRNAPDGTYVRVVSSGNMLALCEMGEGLLTPVRVFNRSG